MGVLSLVGRVLFASLFLLSAYQEFNEFGVDGGSAAKTFKPKFELFTRHVSSHLSVEVPSVDIKHIIAATIALKGIGGILFVFSSSFGAFLLFLYLAFVTPIVHDFYNYDIDKSEFVHVFIKFTQNLALVGALLFFLGMKTSVSKRAKKKGSKAKAA